MKVLFNPIQSIKRAVGEIKFKLWKNDWDSFVSTVEKDANKALGRRAKSKNEKLQDAIDYFKRKDPWNQLVGQSNRDVQEINAKNTFRKTYGKYPEEI